VLLDVRGHGNEAFDACYRAFLRHAFARFGEERSGGPGAGAGATSAQARGGPAQERAGLGFG
jgi:hypothetical protein